VARRYRGNGLAADGPLAVMYVACREDEMATWLASESGERSGPSSAIPRSAAVMARFAGEASADSTAEAALDSLTNAAPRSLQLEAKSLAAAKANDGDAILGRLDAIASLRAALVIYINEAADIAATDQALEDARIVAEASGGDAAAKATPSVRPVAATRRDGLLALQNVVDRVFELLSSKDSGIEREFVRSARVFCLKWPP